MRGHKKHVMTMCSEFCGRVSYYHSTLSYATITRYYHITILDLANLAPQTCYVLESSDSITVFSSKFIRIQNFRIYHECEGRIEKFVPRIAIWHHEACRVMTNGDSEGQIFLSFPHTNNGFFLLLTTVLFIYLFHIY